MTGGMTEWDTISCKRGCLEHHTKTVTVDLSKPHGYHDLSPVPERLARKFDMVVWDTDKHPVDGLPEWCPAHDAVSETITATGIWEPVETVLALHVLSGKQAGIMVDLGCQIGWYSALAATCGREILGIDADPLPLNLFEDTWFTNTAKGRWEARHALVLHRFGDTLNLPDVLTAGFRSDQVCLAKIDVEGAEADAVRWLDDWVGLHNVAHLLIEMSPCFNDTYEPLLRHLVESGFVPYRLPEKQTPPVVVDDVPTVMEDYWMTPDEALARLQVIDQENFWFRREDASW